MTKRMAAIAALLFVLGVGPARANGNMCSGPVDTNCHQGHDSYGYPTGRCDVYVDAGPPTHAYCVSTY